MSDSQHPARLLWERHHPVEYPDGLEAVPEPIPGRAFFPGGLGLYSAEAGKPLPDFPMNGVMVLGHDFDTRANYETAHGHGRELEGNKTWQNLVPLLKDAGIPLGRCFFTNLYMGLRTKGKSTDPNPGAEVSEFREHCKGFLLDQLATQRPRLVLVLGLNVPPVVGEMSAQLASWIAVRNYKQLDGMLHGAAGPIVRGVAFRGLDGFSTTVVALIHPSYRPANLRHRAAGLELKMLREAWPA